MHLKNISATDYFLKTQWGVLKVSIGPDGLNRIFFEDCPSQRIDKDAHFRDTFIHWLHDFQSATTDQQWAALSPRGTDFQKQVWRELLEIPPGSRVSYNYIATRIGRPKANRAVGSAVGANPIALLIPCHRVVPASGGTGNYRWGSNLKQALLEVETVYNADFTQLFKAA